MKKEQVETVKHEEVKEHADKSSKGSKNRDVLISQVEEPTGNTKESKKGWFDCFGLS